MSDGNDSSGCAEVEPYRIMFLVKLFFRRPVVDIRECGP